MAKKDRQFSNSDPRNKVGEDVRVGDRLKGSRVTHVKRERKNGSMGFRIRLEDKRAAWVAPKTKVMDVDFRAPVSAR